MSTLKRKRDGPGEGAPDSTSDPNIVDLTAAEDAEVELETDRNAIRASVAYVNHLRKSLRALTDSETRYLLETAAFNYPDLATSVIKSYDLKVAEKRKRVRDFRDESDRIASILNVQFDQLRLRDQVEFPTKAWNLTVEAVERIRMQIIADTNFQTKLNALMALGKIGQTICTMDNDMLRDSYYDCMQDDETYLEDAMLHIIRHMSDDQRARMNGLEGEAWVDAMEKLLILSGTGDDQILYNDTLTQILNMIVLCKGKGKAKCDDDGESSTNSIQGDVAELYNDVAFVEAEAGTPEKQQILRAMMPPPPIPLRINS